MGYSNAVVTARAPSGRVASTGPGRALLPRRGEPTPSTPRVIGSADPCLVVHGTDVTRPVLKMLAGSDDRERVASDLHDHVIQRVFACGLALAELARAEPDPATAAQLDEVVDDLDDVIRQIRSAIHELGDTGGLSLRRATMNAIAGVWGSASPGPTVRFLGPVDLVRHELHGDITAVIVEALSNTRRHARAGRVAVTVSCSRGELCVVVVDDGVGWGATAATSGLLNLDARASRLGGALTQADTPGGGATLRWMIPTG